MIILNFFNLFKKKLTNIIKCWFFSDNFVQETFLPAETDYDEHR